MTLAELEQVFRRWLYLPDAGALHVVLAAVAANRDKGDPVWVLLVGPPGGGKSEILGGIIGLPDVHQVATLTEASLLSGTPKKDHVEGARGGLLRTIGDFGIIVAKDFTSVLAMNRDARSLLLAALREIYDGSWTRHVGTDGGRTLHWEGTVGFIGGVTPTIDRHHAVMGAMGERFILYRLPAVDAGEHAHRALAHAGREREMRAELTAATATFLSNLEHKPGPFTTEDGDRLVELAILVSRARSAVERDGYTRDIELIPEPEAPTRIVVVLRRLYQGLTDIGLTADQAWATTTKAALDSIPALRLASLLLLQAQGPTETPAIAEALDYPTVTARRALEDLTAHGLVERTIRGEGRRADTWKITDFASTRLTRCVPEKSSYTRNGKVRESLDPLEQAILPISSDISGTQEPPRTDTSGTQIRPSIAASAADDDLPF